MATADRDFVRHHTLGSRAAAFWWRLDPLGNLLLRCVAKPGQSHAAKGRLVSRDELDALLAWLAGREWVLLECLPAKLRDGTAPEGLGRFACEQLGWPPAEAPFVSHVAAVLVAADLLAWNNKKRRMAFRLASDDLEQLRACYQSCRAEATASPRPQPKTPPARKRPVPGGQMPPQFDLPERFRALSRELRAQLDSVSGGHHPAEKGARREAIFRAFLRRILPGTYAIASGEILHSSGESSRQVDALIYPSHSPALLDADTSVVVPAESVLAAIEVKPLLRRGEVVDAIANLRLAKALRPMAIFRPLPRPMHQRPIEPNPPAFTALFSIDSVDPRRVLKVLRELERDTPAAFALDCACLLDRGVITRGAGLAGPPSLPEPLPGGAPVPLTCIEAGEDSLLVFYILLYEQLALRRTHLPDLRAYLGSLRLPPPIEG
ncbi:MAG: hypothetical protein ISS72_03295 [Candidatus Brocadiae bacterium]|nr:hypothetical protein [Candidatus Brocadiia bacterium]